MLLTWIYGLLSNDAVLMPIIGKRVFIDIAPEGTNYPLIVMRQIDSIPITNAYADILMEGERWQIKAIDKATKYGRVNQIVQRVEELMHKARGPNVLSQYWNSRCRCLKKR